MILPIPRGTRDVLPDEMRELGAINDAMRAVFGGAGYGEIYTPALEYESVIGRGALDGAPPGLPRVRRERRGARAALGHDRADRARRRHPLRERRAAAALRLLRPLLPRRAPPARPAARVPAGRDRADRLAGAAGDGGGVERALRAPSTGPASRATASASATPRCIRRCSRASASPRKRGRLLAELGRGDFVGLEARCASSGLDEGSIELLLARAAAARRPRRAARPARPCRRCASPGCAPCTGSSRRDVAARIIFDLGLARPGYYTGAVFEVYDPAVGIPLGGGGRYDDLLGEFGRALPAVGFALEVERVTTRSPPRSAGCARERQRPA